MKFFAIILSIYFLALNFVPCSDASSVDEGTQVVSVMDFDGEHGQDCELCSPFCQCQCCHSHTIDFRLAIFEPIEPIVSLENFIHFDSLGKDISLSLLQPPRA
ncbi:hypothetical protein CSC80_03915 [Maribacter sp. 6B07]|uniref:DUF6660 family protein n=1 Tax=Flavobacteriaceae TaxID=49546 RepID=UPI000C06DB0B|nr:DUF6660 family protein [Maribacter sp. 4G9]MAO18990.1 hypothetical protein [Allomuricauda sp.]MAU17807.1 hypothetical protein [Allomuricauda sp.]MBC74108.1 hypothetical protein [Allomuricauda sp.]PHN94507.1 hypothetical protein CSC80_03915 [Maribacter sp. 6B07]